MGLKTSKRAAECEIPEWLAKRKMCRIVEVVLKAHCLDFGAGLTKIT